MKRIMISVVCLLWGPVWSGAVPVADEQSTMTPWVVSPAFWGVSPARVRAYYGSQKSIYTDAHTVAYRQQEGHTIIVASYYFIEDRLCLITYFPAYPKTATRDQVEAQAQEIETALVAVYGIPVQAKQGVRFTGPSTQVLHAVTLNPQGEIVHFVQYIPTDPALVVLWQTHLIGRTQ